MNVIYLAAGQSKRMGCKKITMPVNGEALGMKALRTILTVPSAYVFVVVNKQDTLEWISADIKERLLNGCGEIVIAEKADKGQSYSLRAGIRQAIERNASNVMICLADQPFITTDMLRLIRSTPIKGEKKYVACVHNGMIKPPVVLSSSLFQQVLLLTGDTGAKKILQNKDVKGTELALTDDELFIDIDTIKEYQRYCVKQEGRDLR
ncbi:nucleotidyltransferase family protein [Niallia circulans]|uniref:Nucleotidyltransferase family protein n=1 Tax=Niallia circulans TaxID=1397 RepID=A0A553SMU3_NIACI|nr:nucleotidyltransferase family protein [Niallia circulans]TRZ38288.1 nucleotidyltransferase family protein [Niallia circulans]